MKITCTCGIAHQLYDYPPGDVSAGGKDMKERHIICNCTREAVVRTSPKDEPDYNDPNADKEGLRRNVISHEALCAKLGLPINTPVIQPAAPPVASTIIDPTATTVSGQPSLFLAKDDADLLREIVTHYGAVFKQGDEEAQAAYSAFVAKIQEGMLSTDPTEVRMVKCAFSDRNLRRLYPVGQYDDETSHNVVRTEAAKSLKDRFETEFGE